MKTKLILLMITTFFLTKLYSQEQCGTMKNLDELFKKDPAAKERVLQIEKKNNEWIELNGLGFTKRSKENLNENSNNIFKAASNINALCGYDNIYFTTIPSPTAVNQIISPTQNCTYGGEFVTVTNLIAGRTYRISTIGATNWDTQITIYPSGGGNSVAFNDDWQLGIFQSEIYFTPIFSGDYDILIDEFNCISNQLCATLEIELIYVPREVITIPVAVHIIHNNEAIGSGTNISDAQIQSQIDVLNEDFRRLNLDILSTPSPFRGSSADPLIQFCLAQQKPDGTPTNGITRGAVPTQAEYSQLGVPAELQCLNYFTMENIIKPNTIWNSDKYLNIWVSSSLRDLPPPNGLGCSSITGTLGYAQFPGVSGPFPSVPANLTDGVWIRDKSFGRVGNVESPYNLGRTATHEVGHWLNLRHIWGDLNDCTDDDLVFDTPKQKLASGGCNIFPFVDDCSTDYPGIMFMNYMDYSNDDCLSLFTFGQFARTEAALFNQRAGLITSQGCVPGSYKVVISQVYGGGGNAGNPSFTNDFIELYNRGTVAQNLGGLSVQYAPAANNIWQTISLPNVSLQPGQYYLIKAATQGTTITNPLPQEDFTSIIPLSASSGKVILVSNTTAETTTNPTGPQIIDKIGYGTANGFEGSATGVLSNTTAAIRNLGGCVDTDDNASDFTVGTPTPRNSSSTFGNCSSLSVTVNENSVIALYPNPTNSKVFFDNSIANFKEVSIYNYLGQEVAKTIFTNSINNQEIDFSNLPIGVYILKFNNGESSKSVKVIKQ